MAMAQAAVRGGFRLIEVTWNSDRPRDLLMQLRRSLPADCCVGTGTVLSLADLRAAAAAGAEFCFTPHIDPALMDLAQTLALPMIPGALTPTEIALAWQAGASSVKVFPVTAVGGSAYIRHLQGPLGHIPLIPTGGVTLDLGRSLLAAGAIAVGLSSSLFPQELVVAQDWDALEARSRSFIAGLKTLKL